MSGLALLSPGTVFARDYRVSRPLREGGMGAVHVAEQLSTSRPCALKVMQPELVNNAEARKRFLREARIGAQLKSDFVVQVIQAGVDDATGMPWLAMELLEGEDLEAKGPEPGPGDRPFDKGAAAATLSAAASRAKGCKQPDGPTGTASVRVVFAPSGKVSSATVQNSPFAGTPVGACIAGHFRSASVPPFDGSTVSVVRPVVIQ